MPGQSLASIAANASAVAASWRYLKRDSPTWNGSYHDSSGLMTATAHDVVVVVLASRVIRRRAALGMQWQRPRKEI